MKTPFWKKLLLFLLIDSWEKLLLRLLGFILLWVAYYIGYYDGYKDGIVDEITRILK